jgi:hypothetical protein
MDITPANGLIVYVGHSSKGATMDWKTAWKSAERFFNPLLLIFMKTEETDGTGFISF